MLILNTHLIICVKCWMTKLMEDQNYIFKKWDKILNEKKSKTKSVFKTLSKVLILYINLTVQFDEESHNQSYTSFVP